MPNELKPCPFCGGKAKLYSQKVAGGYDYSYVFCESCKIGTKKYEVSPEYCANDKATEAWNRRADNG